MHLATFALTMAIGQLTPGPDMLLILKNTLNRGMQQGLATIAGICLGIIAHVTIVITGFAALLSRLPSVLTAIRILGALYLAWVAYQLLRSLAKAPTNGLGEQTLQREGDLATSFREGLFTNLANVKVMVLFSSLLAPAIALGTATAWLYGSVIIIEAAVIWPLFAWIMRRTPIRKAFFRYQRGLNACFAVLLLGFAVYLVQGA